METNIKKDALTFLQGSQQLTAVVASVDATGQPHAATIYYYVDADFNFFFLTATGTRKYQNLLTQHKSAIVVGTGPELTTIQGSGSCALLEKNSDEESMAMLHIKKRLAEHDGTWPIFQLEQFDDEAIAVFKFTPTSLQLLNLVSDNNLPATTKDIQSIL
jgi:uncharacterized protein YhbP (UPF0306 family)